jgi:hypothetical protein
METTVRGLAAWRAAMPVLGAAMVWAASMPAPAATVEHDVFIRSQAFATQDNPLGFYGGLVTEGVFDGFDTRLDQVLRVERSLPVIPLARWAAATRSMCASN